MRVFRNLKIEDKHDEMTKMVFYVDAFNYFRGRLNVIDKYKEVVKLFLEDDYDNILANRLKSDAHLSKKEFNYSKITKGLVWQLDRIKHFILKTILKHHYSW